MLALVEAVVADIATTPVADMAIASVSEADPIFPSSGITMFPPVVIAPLKVAFPPSLMTKVSAVMSTTPSVPLKTMSVSVPCASIVIFPEEVAIVTAASPKAMSFAATGDAVTAPHEISVPSDFKT